MVTAELLYALWEAVVTSHKSGVSFAHDTSKILDRDSAMKWPACLWKLPPSTLSSEGRSDIFYPNYTLSMAFLEQTATDRGPDEMLQAHARMDAIAKQCWLRFYQRYVSDTTVFQGVEVDLELISEPKFTPVWDDEEVMVTGVIMTVTVKANGPVECDTAYFNN